MEARAKKRNAAKYCLIERKGWKWRKVEHVIPSHSRDQQLAPSLRH